MLGAIIGDVVGSVYEFNNIRTKKFELITRDSTFTDDSIMTFAIADIIQKGIIDDKEKVIDAIKRWGRAYLHVGYGGMFKKWLVSDDRSPYNSFGNGSAMRIAAVGWYAKNEVEVKDMAYKVTSITHNHPEGLKGAEVVAMCIYYARIGKSKRFIKEYVSNYYDLSFDYNDLNKNYRFNETCQKSVPQAIYCFLISKDFEDCIRTTISIGGDCDTTAAISGAIAHAFYKKIDEKLLNHIYKIIPESIDGCDIRAVIDEFIEDNK